MDRSTRHLQCVPWKILDVSPDPIQIIQSSAIDRRRREHKHVGWLYVMHNPAYREPWLKIGKSSRPPNVRARELGSATGVPEEFHTLHFVHVRDRHEAEKQVHAVLAKYRKSPGKEFFDVPLPVAADTLNRVAQDYPIVVGGSSGWLLPQYHDSLGIQCQQCGRLWRVPGNRISQLITASTHGVSPE